MKTPKPLRGLKLHVVCPDGPDRALISACLRRVGLEADAVWPYPDALPSMPGLCVIFADSDGLGRAVDLIHSYPGVSVLLLESELIREIGSIVAAGCHGVLVHPLRPEGIVTQLCLAAANHARIVQLGDHLERLQDNLRSRRVIERAVRSLVARHGISDDDAFEMLRTQAMRRRTSVVDLARTLIDPDLVPAAPDRGKRSATAADEAATSSEEPTS